MTVTVLAITEPEIKPAAPLSKVMNERLQRLAKVLQDEHLSSLSTVEPLYEDVVIYISYNKNYAVRWRIVNDVPIDTENRVAKECDKLGYIKWKTETLNIFKAP
ncbi:hypothetical protein LPB86_17865 [Pedobacter sp. MC2016-14]|uniref:hypothetical protein n=1 Tax=Pedobacter sp. MC2016-14 TaxID=2897327 RepID=UPI001E53C931|nr:hypothetical protein [Pedobacter sp. MC2016-14]MCD0490112.1 hypothetical protein [Pedobacter sp. MC2016-14]